MEARGIDVRERIPASRKLGKSDARTIANSSSRVVVAKGKKLRDFGGSEPKVDAMIVPTMLGATGNLRAPLIRVGEITVVGFNQDVYAALFN